MTSTNSVRLLQFVNRVVRGKLKFWTNDTSSVNQTESPSRAANRCINDCFVYLLPEINLHGLQFLTNNAVFSKQSETTWNSPIPFCHDLNDLTSRPVCKSEIFVIYTISFHLVHLFAIHTITFCGNWLQTMHRDLAYFIWAKQNQLFSRIH